MRSSLRFLLLALLLACPLTPAGADLPFLRALVTGDSTFLMEGFDLSERDQTLAMESQAALLADAAAVPGTQVAWSNAQSGSSGSVTLLRSFDFDGQPCRRLLHQIAQKSQGDPVYVHTIRCRMSDGAWKSL
jgi:surface antigen